MKTLQELLKDGDPLAHEPGLGGADAHAMRRVVVAAADEATPPNLWRQAMLMTAMAALMLAAIVSVARRQASVPVTGRALPPAEVEFSTPGGTRVIWQFQQGSR